MRANRDMQILWMSGPKTGSFSFQRSLNCLPRLERKKCAGPENRAADSEDQEIPVAPDEIAHVDQELRRSGQLGAEVLEDFAENRNDPDDQEGGDREGDADHDDRISHGRLDLLAQTRAGFEEAGQPIENLGQQTAGFARFHHADEQPIEDARMLRDRLVKGFAALDARGDVADDVAQIALPFRVALLVERGQRLDERDAGLDHGGELAGKENEIGLLDRPDFFAWIGWRSLFAAAKEP